MVILTMLSVTHTAGYPSGPDKPDVGIVTPETFGNYYGGRSKGKTVYPRKGKFNLSLLSQLLIMRLCFLIYLVKMVCIYNTPKHNMLGKLRT